MAKRTLEWHNDFGYGGAKQAALPRGNEFYNVSKDRGKQKKTRVHRRFAEKVTAQDKALVRFAMSNKPLPAYKIADLLGISRPTMQAMINDNGAEVKNFSEERFITLVEYLGIKDEMECLKCK